MRYHRHLISKSFFPDWQFLFIKTYKTPKLTDPARGDLVLNQFFCKSTGHGRFRDSSALSAAIAALTTAQEGVQPARATNNCNAANDPLTTLPSDSLPVKRESKIVFET